MYSNQGLKLHNPRIRTVPCVSYITQCFVRGIAAPMWARTAICEGHVLHLTLVSAQALQAELTQKHDRTISYTDVLSAAMYPQVFDEYR